MRVSSVRLTNVKSYAEATIPFAEGVTFVAGLNGAGKSTILEAIGYALFNWSPSRSPSEYLLRRGQTMGEIRVRFEANDERFYEVRRSIGRRSRWEVRDLEIDMPLDLHGSADVIDQLRVLLGVERDWKMEDLFTQVLSVEQGQFTAPFLQADTNRRALFDPIFKLDAYRNAYVKASAGERALETQVHQLELDMAANQARLEGYDELVAFLEADRARAVELGERLAVQERERDAAEATLAALKERRERVEALGRQEGQLDLQVRNLDARIAELDGQIAAARDADAAVVRLKSDYDRYQALTGRATELERLLAGRATAEARRADLAERIASLDASIAERSKGIADRRADLAARIERATTALATARAAHDEATARHEAMAAELATWERVEESAAQIAERIARLERIVDRAEGTAGDAAADERRLRRLEATAEEAAHAEPVARDLARREERRQELRRELAATEEKRAILRRYKQIASGRTCPFLREECPVIRGDFGALFDGQLGPIEERLVALGGELAAAETAVAEAASADERWRTLRAGLEEISPLRQRLADRRAAVARELDAWRASAPLETAELAGVPAPEAPTEIEGDEGWPAVVARLGTGRDAWVGWRRRVGERVRARLAECRAACTRAERAVAETSAAVERHEAEIATARDEHAGLAVAEAQVNADRERLAGLRRERDGVDAAVAAFDAYEAERRRVSEERSVLEATQAAYVEAAARAKDLAGLRAARDGAAGERARAADALAACRRELAGATGEDLAARIRGAEGVVREQQRRCTVVESELGQVRARVGERTAERQRLDGVRAELRRQRREKDVVEKAQRLFRAMRAALNRAAEPIAERYRDAISQDANNIHRQIASDTSELIWADAYEIQLSDLVDGVRQMRTFRQLSGGEQMSAALAVRLALMRYCSTTGIGMFDEPTMNLDGQRRMNLAKVIPEVAAQGFRQLIVISHDDTFDALSENIVRLEKSPRGTIVHEEIAPAGAA